MFHDNDKALWVPHNQIGHDPLHKICPVFDCLQKCRQVFYLGQNLTVDDRMCLFRGRVSFCVYIKNKPNKYVLKFYIVSDVKTGYILNAEV